MKRLRSRVMMQSLLHNVYSEPTRDYLEQYAGSLLGTVRISRVEIQTAMTDEGAFVALLSARLRATLGEMAAAMRAPTLPGHDEPGE